MTPNDAPRCTFSNPDMFIENPYDKSNGNMNDKMGDSQQIQKLKQTKSNKDFLN